MLQRKRCDEVLRRVARRALEFTRQVFDRGAMLEQLTSEPALRYVMIGFAVLCVVMGFLRGIGRLILFGLAIAAGVAAALVWFRYMPALCIAWFGKNSPGIIQWGAIGTGLVVAWFARRFLNTL